MWLSQVNNFWKEKTLWKVNYSCCEHITVGVNTYLYRCQSTGLGVCVCVCVCVCKYDRVLNMFQDAWKDSEYFKILNMPDFCICVTQGSEYVWIRLNNARINCSDRWLWQGSEYAWSKFHRILNMLLVLNMPGLRIRQGCEYARVTKDAEDAWICLENASICVNMP